MKQSLNKISPFNHRTDMPASLFVIKKILAFWVCYIAGLFIAEGLVILLHFALGKNMLVGDVFEAGTITLITYYGYIIIAGAALLYWKVIEANAATTIVLAFAVTLIVVMSRHSSQGLFVPPENTLAFECAGITEGGKFPVENTGRGKDISPEFVIKNLSPHAKTFIITLEDLSHPMNRFTHWVIWNIPAADKIPKAIPAGKTLSSPAGAVQGIGYGLHRYAGPKPPKGKSHRYCFRIYALDCKMNLKPFSTKSKVLNKAYGHIIQQGEICGYFE